jgi:GT2 family glycosyltransferase
VIIATLDRVDSLRCVLACLSRQTRPPDEVILCAAGELPATLLTEFHGFARIRLLPSAVKSSARQRNQAADVATGEVLAFLDDDIEFEPDLLERALTVLAHAPEIGGLHPRIRNMEGNSPGLLTRAYYTLQSGYAHPNHGGKLFGPGLNCAPVFNDATGDRVAAEWLPSTCLFLRADLFRQHRFPEFDGYSFAEDVHLTARIAHEAPLWFLREPSILHHSLTSEFKTDRTALTAGKLHNMAVVAREVQHLRGVSLWWRWQLHRLFISAVLLLRRPDSWRQDFLGVWRSHP